MAQNRSTTARRPAAAAGTEPRPCRPPTLRRRIQTRFETFAHAVSVKVGSPWAFMLAAGTIVAWGLTGPLFGYSDSWQLIINTGTTIVTFLMVFLIQQTQNKDAHAIQLKLNELIAALEGASNRLIDIEELSDEELERLHARFRKLVGRARRAAYDGEAHSVAEES